MTPDEADRLAARLKGMIPTMTDEQIRFWAQRFERYDQAAGEAAVDRYVSMNSELKNQTLIGLIEAEQWKRGGSYAETQERLADAKAKREQEEIDRVIASFTDEDLETMKPDALKHLEKTLEPYALGIVAKRHPRHSALLKSAIYEMVSAKA